MFLRSCNRKKDGKDHRYFSIVENRRLDSGRTALYLGEINDQQQAAWRWKFSMRTGFPAYCSHGEQLFVRRNAPSVNRNLR
jgi:hypothetical protein